MNFYVGQKVVCVDDSATKAPSSFTPPVSRGCVYTVFTTRQCGCGAQSIDVGILAQNPVRLSVCHCGRGIAHDGAWWVGSYRFRPLLEADVHCELLADLGHRLVEEKPEHVNVPQPSRA